MKYQEMWQSWPACHIVTVTTAPRTCVRSVSGPARPILLLDSICVFPGGPRLCLCSGGGEGGKPPQHCPTTPCLGFLFCTQDHLAGPHPGPSFPSADQHGGECVLAPRLKSGAEPAPGWGLRLPPAAGDECGAPGRGEGAAG